MVRLRAVHTISAVLILVVFVISTILVLFAVPNPVFAMIFSFMNIIGATFPPVDSLVDAHNPFVISSLAISIIGNLAFTIIFTTLFYQILSGVSIGEWLSKRKVAGISRHVIITPINGISIDLAKKLSKNKIAAVLLDSDRQKVRAAARMGEIAVRGDATHRDSLLEVGIGRAFALFALSDDDISNTFTTIEARSLNERCCVIARVKRLEDISRLRRAGARKMIMPEAAVGIELGNYIVANCATQ